MKCEREEKECSWEVVVLFSVEGGKKKNTASTGTGRGAAFVDVGREGRRNLKKEPCGWQSAIQ